ncbi:cell division protein FtsW [Spirochaetia bacterium]|nr:cell division protein FtsW [Spirochaetia bacterium]
MYHFDAEKTESPRGVHLLSASVLLLTGLGLVTLYSSSYAFAGRFFNDSYHFIFRQSIFGAGGIVLFFIASIINLEIVRKLIKPLVALAALLCALTLIPGIGVERLGASRWIKIGSYTYQPSEMVKLVLPLYLAHILAKKQDGIYSFRYGVFPPVFITGIFFLLIYAQNNFSTAIFIVLNAMVIFFLAGVRFRYFFAAIVMFVPLSALLIFTKEHRVRRLLSFIKPEWDPLGAGFQVRSSLLTIISGGFWGKGIGQGTRKIASVPEIHSDFIFSAFAEEAGFIGVLLFFILFAIFAVQGYRGAWRSDSVFKKLLASGLVTMIVSQALLNVAVVSGAVPATGIPLPFFSAGGSSLATTLICAGLIVNVARRGREEAAPGDIENFRDEAVRFSPLEGQDVR